MGFISSGICLMSQSHPLVLTVGEVAHHLGISRATAYKAIRDGEIPSIRIGVRYLIPKIAFEKMINSDPPRPKARQRRLTAEERAARRYIRAWESQKTI
jgi:excisionase family DNA binding protein